MKTATKKNRRTISNVTKAAKYFQPVYNGHQNLLASDLSVKFSNRVSEKMQNNNLVDFELLEIERLEDGIWFSNWNKKDEKLFRVGDTLILKKTETIEKNNFVIFKRHVGDTGLRLGRIIEINGEECMLDTPNGVIACLHAHFKHLYKVWGKVEIERY